MELKEILKKLMPRKSMAGVAFVIVVITASGRDSLILVGAVN